MAARILSGKTIADAIKAEIAAEIKALEIGHGFRPCLAAVRVSLDPASEVYVTNKIKTAAELGIISEHHHLSAETSHDELLALVRDLNYNNEVDGILVQLPLPKHINERDILEAIDPAAVNAGQTLFLWVIESDGSTRAVGAVPQGKFVQVALPKTSEQLFAKATELAVTVETIGSTPAAPSAPFVYRGLCGKLWRVAAPKN